MTAAFDQGGTLPSGMTTALNPNPWPEPILAVDEQAKVDEILADLRSCGYRDVDAADGVAVGARVRHANQRWPEAYTHGTGVVLHVLERAPSPWSQTWYQRDVELVVIWDKPWNSPLRVSQLAQYHVDVIGGAA